jgi:hypothetical protein
MSRVSAVIAAFALLLLSSVGALAEGSIKTATANEVAEILKGAGYRAEIVSSTQRPYVRTGIGGHNVVVLMFDCKAEACSGIQFWTGIKKTDKFTVSFVEGWNAARRLAKFHLTKDGDLHVEYDIDLSGGVSPDYIKQAALLYERLLARMDEYIKAAPSAPAAEIVSKAREADIFAGAGKFSEAVDVLDDATISVWLRAPLALRRALWVEAPADGFGMYKPRENNVYGPGAQMFLYTEPFGYGWRKVGDMWETDFVADLELRNKDGVVLLRQREFMNKQARSKVRNREFMANFTYRFSDIPAGEYIADTTLRDRVTGKSVTSSLPFVVR